MFDTLHADFENTPVSGKRPDYKPEPRVFEADPLVSIITPFFNTEGGIFEKSAFTVLNQSFQQFEWLIINDASTDPDALAILDVYRHSGDPRIRVVDLTSNGGPSAARNRGVESARTDFVFHFDSDDLIEPTAIEKCFWYLTSHPDCPWVNGWSVGFGHESYLWKFGFQDRERFREANWVTGRTMIRKSVHLQMGGYDESLRSGCEDWDYWMKGASLGHWGHTIPEVFDWYRRRPNHWEKWDTIADERNLTQFRQQLQQRYPALYREEFPAYEPAWPRPFETPSQKPSKVNLLKKEGLRLVLIFPWLEMGGADKFNLDLVEFLALKGWSLTILTTRSAHNAWAGRFAKFTPEIFHLPHIVRPVDKPDFIREIISSRNPDAVLLSNSELVYWLLPYLRHHFPKLPFLDYLHIEEAYWKNGGYPRYSIGARDHLSMSLVTSEHLRAWMLENGHTSPERVRVVYINVDHEVWKPDSRVRARLRNEAGLDNAKPVLFFAGRICPQKQPEVLASVTKALAAKGLDFCLWIAGDGENREWLQNELQEVSQLGKVVFLGSLSSEDVRKRMQAADIFFLPSRWEGIALSIYEAMSIGLPVVGANVGGQAELVTEETGILIDSPAMTLAEQVNAYVDALSELISDQALRLRMGMSARERIGASFTIDKMGHAIEQAIKDAEDIEVGAPSPPIPEGFALESATRAVEFFRLDRLADELWDVLYGKGGGGEKQLVEAKAANDADVLRYWDHLHRFIPFRFFRWWHTGTLFGWLRRKTGKPVHPAYDSTLVLSERLSNLTQTNCYKRVLSLRKYSSFAPYLPKPKFSKGLK